MPVVDPCLIRSRTPAGDRTVRLGVPLVDEYLEFVAARCRPNTVLAVAYDLKVFFRWSPSRRARSPRRTCWGSSPPSAPAWDGRSGCGAIDDERAGCRARHGGAAAVERVGVVRVPAGPR